MNNVNFYKALPGETHYKFMKRKITITKKIQRLTILIDKLKAHSETLETIAERYGIMKEIRKHQHMLGSLKSAIYNELKDSNYNSPYHNFNGELDEVKELETIENIIGYSPGLDEIISYRLLMIHGTAPTKENIYAYSVKFCGFEFLKYYTQDVKAIQTNPLHFLDQEQKYYFDEQGYTIDDETGERAQDSEPLQPNLYYCFLIDGYIYEAFEMYD